MKIEKDSNTLPLLPEDLVFLKAHMVELCHSSVAMPILDQNIFLTGGTGFFGKWLILSWLVLKETIGHSGQLWLLTRDAESFKENFPSVKNAIAQGSICIIDGDIRTFTWPQWALEKKLGGVIHAATPASASLNEQHPTEMLSIIVDGTRNLFKQLESIYFRRLLFTSSGAVYGVQPSELLQIPETYLGAPSVFKASSAYGEGKRFVEHLCFLESQKKGFDLVTARAFAFVGPYLPLDSHFAVGNFLSNALKSQSIQVAGSGQPYRSYLYAADLAVWLWTLWCKGTAGEAYNVGSDQAISIIDLAEKVGKKYNCTVSSPNRISSESSATSELGVPRYVPSIQKAALHLGLKVNMDLDSSIDRTYRFYKNKMFASELK